MHVALLVFFLGIAPRAGDLPSVAAQAPRTTVRLGMTSKEVEQVLGGPAPFAHFSGYALNQCFSYTYPAKGITVIFTAGKVVRVDRFGTKTPDELPSPRETQNER